MKAILFVAAFMFTTTCFGGNALEQLNKRRVKAGLPAYKADAKLQAAAERSAQRQSKYGAMQHCCHIGSRSGVGCGSGSDPKGYRFNTCYAFNYGGGYAGAAAVVGRNGQTYYALDIRTTPSPTTTKTKPAPKTTTKTVSKTTPAEK